MEETQFFANKMNIRDAKKGLTGKNNVITKIFYVRNPLSYCFNFSSTIYSPNNRTC